MAQKKGEVSTLIYLESNVRRVFFVLQDIAKNNYWINVFEKLTKIKKIKKKYIPFAILIPSRKQTQKA